MQQESVAVVVAHPDDEVLAFGGTICRHVDAGIPVNVLILATGLAARTAGGVVDPKELEKLRNNARAAGAILGLTEIEFAAFPDNRMDSVPLLDVVKEISAFIEKVDATTVYTHHVGDLNIDHSITARAVMTACRPLPDSHVRRIYAGEVISSSEYSFRQDRFVPNIYGGIDRYLDRKCEALKCYSTELRGWPHPRSVEAVVHLARLRGSECGLTAAEALLLVFERIPEPAVRQMK